MPDVQRVTLPIDDPLVDAVTAAVHEPSRRRARPVLLTPGAGGDLDGEGLVALAEILQARGHAVVRANLPHREVGRRAPRAERSVAPLRSILDAATALLRPRRSWIVGGKSYGGRVASLAVAEGLEVAGLLFYGYPLHPPGKPERLRVDHWPQIGVPCLFLQGDRDRFCELPLLEARLRKLPRRPTLIVVRGGDHSLRVTGAAASDGQPRSPAQTITELDERIAGWIASLDA